MLKKNNKISKCAQRKIYEKGNHFEEQVRQD